MFEEYNSIMNVEEVCEALSAGKNYIYSELNQQNLHGFRIGRIWRIPKECLIKYVSEQSKLYRR